MEEVGSTIVVVARSRSDGSSSNRLLGSCVHHRPFGETLTTHRAGTAEQPAYSSFRDLGEIQQDPSTLRSNVDAGFFAIISDVHLKKTSSACFV